MFSGLIEEVGVVRSIAPMGQGIECTIHASTVLSDCSVDDSIAVQGACLTVVEVGADWFRVQMVEETLRKTTLGRLRQGSRVNLERALQAGSRLGGHIVQGHVDCTGIVTRLRELSASHELSLQFPLEYAPLVVTTGSICVDGISLTVARAEEQECLVAIIPHTWDSTTVSDLQEGSAVNIEFDVVAKYVQSLVRLQ